MRKLDWGEYQFSDWVPFSQREDQLSLHCSGVYVIAYSTKVLNGMADPISQDVVYIGETTSESVRFHRRLREFHTACSIGKGAHSGGRRAYIEMPHLLGNAYISIAPIQTEIAALRIAKIKYLERLLILAYIERHQQLPTLNSY